MLSAGKCCSPYAPVFPAEATTTTPEVPDGALGGDRHGVAQDLWIVGTGVPLLVERELRDSAEADADDIHAVEHCIVNRPDDGFGVAEFVDIRRTEDLVVAEERLRGDPGERSHRRFDRLPGGDHRNRRAVAHTVARREVVRPRELRLIGTQQMDVTARHDDLVVRECEILGAPFGEAWRGNQGRVDHSGMLDVDSAIDNSDLDACARLADAACLFPSLRSPNQVIGLVEQLLETRRAGRPSSPLRVAESVRPGLA